MITAIESGLERPVGGVAKVVSLKPDDTTGASSARAGQYKANTKAKDANGTPTLNKLRVSRIYKFMKILHIEGRTYKPFVRDSLVTMS